MPYYPPRVVPQFLPMPVFGASSRFWTWPSAETTPSTTSLPAGRIYLTPFGLTRTAPARALAVNVEITAAATGATWRFGIYRADGLLEPGAVVFDGGAVSAATVGRATWTIPAATAGLLTPGDYFFGLYALGTAAATCRAIAAHAGVIPQPTQPAATPYGALRTAALDTTATNAMPAAPVMVSNGPSPRYEISG